VIEAAELRALGLDERAAGAAAGLFAAAAGTLGGGAEHAWWVPGRIEILGKHTDYCGGQSLVCATGLGIAAVARTRADGQIIVHSGGQTVDIAAAAAVPELDGWGRYVATVIRRMQANFGPLGRGMELALAENLPRAAGMSSSSALMIAVFTALGQINRVAEHAAYRAAIHAPEQLASYLGCVENGQSFGPLAGDAGVGTFGGSEDHAAILLGRPGAALRLSFGPLRVERLVPLPAGYTLVVADSGVEAIKTGAAKDKYNRCSHLAREALARWNRLSGRHDSTLFAVLAVSAEQRDRLAELLGSEPDAFALARRTVQLWEEAGVILPAACAALERNDLSTFGALVDRSQQLAEACLRNQVPETVALHALARAQGAVAASAFGAGFGGAVWALVPDEGAEDFGARWLRAYSGAFPDRQARCFVAGASVGLRQAR
jgi:galactokinase